MPNPFQGWSNMFFDAFGEDLDFVKAMHELNPRCIWTQIETDNTDDDDCVKSIITPGYQCGGSLGYYITEVPFDESDVTELTVD